MSADAESTTDAERLAAAGARARAGNLERGRAKLDAQGKLFVRDRIDLLCDPGTFVEDALLANASATDLPADGVVTGIGDVDGRPVVVVANDPTVKAGSWGARTVEKIVRATEAALSQELPIVWLVDSAGARITDQVQLFPGRRGAGRIFHNQVKLSGRVPQVCALFGPSAAGGAYIPAFCDLVIMVEGNASMYLGSPRMAQMVIGEEATLEETGGARMHATVSGSGDNLAADDEEAAGYDVHEVIDELIDAESFFEIKPLFAPELVTGFGLIEGRPVGIVANNPAIVGGVLFVDSADKAARFIWLCDAFSIPLVFLADVPGFMIGTEVERQGIIRHGAKMITAVSEATVAKISIILRKAYGAGLYAMAGPAFDPVATLALPTAKIAVMGPEAAVNAVFANKIAEITDPAEQEAFIAERRAEYEADVDLLRLASELVVDAVIDWGELRREIHLRLSRAEGRVRHFSDRRHGVPPV